MIGKFDSLKDQVVYRASLDGATDQVGDMDYGLSHTLVHNLYGRDYIVTENSSGFVMVESYASTFEENGQTFKSAEANLRFSDLEEDYSRWIDQVFGDNEGEE